MVAPSFPFSNDVIVIANAYRSASEEDNRLVLNTMAAKKTASSLTGLKFFVVPATWLLKAYPMISALPSQTASTDDHNGDGDGWRERVGIIQNAPLVASCDHAVSSSDDEEVTNNRDSHHHNHGNQNAKVKTQQPSPEQCQLRGDLRHGEDYFLLGPNAWQLLSLKFGTDGNTIGCPCVFHNAEGSTLAVDVDRSPKDGKAGCGRLVPIPPAGYFPYGRLLKDLEGESAETFMPQNSSQQGAQHQPGQQQQPEVNTASDVVSDEEGDENDLFPGHDDDQDDMILSEESENRSAPSSQPAEGNNVLLLPSSTTALSPSVDNKTNEGSLYPSVDNMVAQGTDRVSNDDDDVDNGSSPTCGTMTAAVVPATVTTNRKRYGSGLGNLGNTCFMNSTLQCLAHTDPLRLYFLSGDYDRDLNRDNPLGTGGDLAIQFAQLLAEMWGTASAERRNVFPKIDASNYMSTVSSVVYPRSFKYTLGKHAEQFMGYDQHDSQELATYLLDALHEDTNRVTKKPYVEKPEKGEDEDDEVAAKKAWDLHLKREDSRVLEMFMGQVKSRVQCCKDGCGRVSTTFDPFMFLSVPIPGSTERTISIVFVPLDPTQRRQNLSVTLSKTATVAKLVEKTVEQLTKAGFTANGRPFALDDLCACDIWTHEVYSFHKMDDDIDKIRDSDVTMIFELMPTSEIKKLKAEQGSDRSSEDETIASKLESTHPYRPRRFTTDPATSLQLRGEQWQTALERYTMMPNTQLMKILNPRRGTNSERFDLYEKMDSFLAECIRDSDKAGNKRARDEDDGFLSNPQEQMISADSECASVSADEDEVPALIERSEASETFCGVKRRYDLAIIEECSVKLRRMLSEAIKDGSKKSSDVFVVQIINRKCSGASYVQEKAFGYPFVLRVPSNITVYGLREEVAKRLSRSLRSNFSEQQKSSMPHQEEERATPESDVIPMEGDSDRGEDEQPQGFEAMNVSLNSHGSGGDPALLILRQIPLSHKKKQGRHFAHNTKRLGSVDVDSYDSNRPIKLASPTDEEEQELVSEGVSDEEIVYLDWPQELFDRVFDAKEFEMCDDVKDPDEEAALAAKNHKANRLTTILDCVEKYCQMEQLEETEMWYCNRCKEHVRAWKQFHLYRAPPILIIHLKRFQYSASTHRRDKISTFIDFPLEGLDLTGQVMHWTEDEKPIYDCYAVSNHYGGLGGGHYTAYALHNDGVWCHYDDSRITESVDPKDVVSEAAYVVYYRRKDVVVNDDYMDGLEAPTIVTDLVETKVRTPSETSSTHAAHGDDMDVDDMRHTDTGSNASTCATPMDSHGGGSDYGENEGMFYGRSLESNADTDYPLQ